VNESESSRNEQGRWSVGFGDSGSVGLRERVCLRGCGWPYALLDSSDSDKRPEVKRREYWWNGISAYVGAGYGGGAGGGETHGRSSLNTKAK